MKAEQTNDDQEHPLPAMIYPRRYVFLMHEVDTRKRRKILSTAGGREGSHSQCIRSQVKVQPVATHVGQPVLAGHVSASRPALQFDGFVPARHPGGERTYRGGGHPVPRR